MSSLRIAAITFDWYPFDPLVRRLAEAAIDAGHSVDVICLRKAGEPARETCNAVQIYRVPMDRGFGRSLPLMLFDWCRFLLLAGFFVTRLYFKRAYDVIHVHNMPDFLVFAALIPRLFGAKVILEVQDTCPELMSVKAKGLLRGLVTRLAIWQETISTRFAHHVITVGWPFEQCLLQRGVPADKMTIILNSPDPRLFPASRRFSQPPEPVGEDHPFIVMYHGTVAERNGLDTAIRALAIARAQVPNLRLDIKGRGENLPYLKQLASQLGISESVVFTDPCPSEALVDFVEHGHVGIIPYRSNSFMELILPTKAYEFAWMHRPIIASDTRGIRSMFRPESIILCEPEQPASFAAAIIDLYQNPDKRAALTRNAAEDYTPYQWPTMAERYRALLTSLTQRQKGVSLPANSSTRPALADKSRR